MPDTRIVPLNSPCEECGIPGYYKIFVYCDKCSTQIAQEYDDMFYELEALRAEVKVLRNRLLGRHE